MGVAHVGDYALFGGGNYSYGCAIVDAYDKSLTKSIATDLLQNRYSLAATTVGDYALFGGGYYNSTFYSITDAYDISLTHLKSTDFSIGKMEYAATTVGDYALFGGGRNSGSGYLSTIEVYSYMPYWLRQATKILININGTIKQVAKTIIPIFD